MSADEVAAGSNRLDIGVFGTRGIPSTYSGYETFLTVLLPELAARGHTVTIYCRRDQVPPVSSYRGVRCVHLPAPRSKQLSTPVHGWVAAGRARLARHDVVLVMNVANVAACMASRLFGQRIVLNTDGQEWIRTKWGRAGRAVFLGSAHVARWGANALVADSRRMCDIYEARFGARSTVIPYCWTGIEPTSPGILERLGVRPRRYLLAAGRLVPENNIETIAAAHLRADVPIPLVVMGTANYRSPVLTRLDELARWDSRVVLAGHVDDRAVYASLVAGAQAYLHGHSVGGINPSLLEAMGCGARIVALDTAFNREALGDAGDYFGDTAGDLVKLIRAVVNEPLAANEAMRTAARLRVNARFSLKSVADAYECLLGIVARRPPWARAHLPTVWAEPETA